MRAGIFIMAAHILCEVLVRNQTGGLPRILIIIWCGQENSYDAGAPSVNHDATMPVVIGNPSGVYTRVASVMSVAATQYLILLWL